MSASSAPAAPPAGAGRQAGRARPGAPPRPASPSRARRGSRLRFSSAASDPYPSVPSSRVKTIVNATPTRFAAIVATAIDAARIVSGSRRAPAMAVRRARAAGAAGARSRDPVATCGTYRTLYPSARWAPSVADSPPSPSRPPRWPSRRPRSRSRPATTSTPICSAQTAPARPRRPPRRRPRRAATTADAEHQRRSEHGHRGCDTGRDGDAGGAGHDEPGAAALHRRRRRAARARRGRCASAAASPCASRSP